VHILLCVLAADRSLRLQQSAVRRAGPRLRFEVSSVVGVIGLGSRHRRVYRPGHLNAFHRPLWIVSIHDYAPVGLGGVGPKSSARRAFRAALPLGSLSVTGFYRPPRLSTAALLG
jgi:hypothetical protein